MWALFSFPPTSQANDPSGQAGSDRRRSRVLAGQLRKTVTLHRAPSITGSVTAGLRQAMAFPTDPNAGVAAGLIAILAAFWNLHVVALLILVVAGGVIDLWAGSRRARINGRLGRAETFDRKKLDEGAEGKAVVLIIYLFLGVSADTLIILAAGGLEIVTILETYTPATTALLVSRLAREMSSIIENYEATPSGKGQIWPGIKKFIDILRFKLSHPEADSFPNNRWDDKGNLEKKAWHQEQLAALELEIGLDVKDGGA